MSKKLNVIFIGVVFIFLTGCAQNLFSGKLKNERLSIEKDEAKQLDVFIDVGAGELNITSGSSGWIKGELQFTPKSVKVSKDYELNGDIGIFTIEQKGKLLNFAREQKNRWDLEINDSIPVDLTIDAGVSDSSLDLRNVQLTNFVFDGGVGDIDIDLSGKYKKSFQAQITTGVGESTIILPEDIGVKITFSKGIGNANFEGFLSIGNNEYVNLAYDTADVVIHIDAETGVGDTTFKLR